MAREHFHPLCDAELFPYCRTCQQKYGGTIMKLYDRRVVETKKKRHTKYRCLQCGKVRDAFTCCDCC